MGLDQQKTIRGVRLSLTCILLFLLTWYYEVPESAWCLITIWFVMYEYTTVGGVFTKSIYRVVGTSLSALYGLFIIYLCGNNFVIDALALTPAVLIYSYYFMDGERAYIAVIGCVTLTIVLFNYNQVAVALIRTFNILLGVVGSMFMIRFFYPQYARDILIVKQSDFLSHLSEMLSSYIDTTLSYSNFKSRYTELEQALYAQLPSFNRLIYEAKIETIKTPLYINYSKHAVEQTKHLFRLISLLVNFLHSEEIRYHPWVVANVNQIRTHLDTLCAQLTPEENTKNNGSPLTASPAPPAPEGEIQLLKLVFTTIQKEITLLESDINNIVMIYERYKKHSLTVPN